MTYSPRHHWLSILTPTLALGLGLGACDGDLGKDSASDSGTSSASATEGSGSTAGSATDTSGASAGGSSEGGAPCNADACGPAPGAPDIMCEDGTTAGWVCVDGGQGCGWQMEQCPPSDGCTEEQCGPAPGAPSQLCPDGVNYSGPGPCELNAQGVCGWTWVDCPACCDPAALPDCPEPITCCGDGNWTCGPADPNCQGNGEALACDDGGGTTGGSCVDEQGSCAGGEECCTGLTCCEGVPVPPGQEYCGIECPISDRNAKENFATVDVHQVLEKVTQLDILTWNYKTSPDAVRHLGPMAQDFMAAFTIGGTDKAIFQVDADGVALASIQALDSEIETLRAENAELKAALATLTRRVDAMK
jgi:hypothetical protein